LIFFLNLHICLFTQFFTFKPISIKIFTTYCMFLPATKWTVNPGKDV
jgi:hypothetical protein